MIKQTKLHKLIWLTIGTVAIAVVGVFAIDKIYSTDSESVSDKNLENIIKSPNTWSTAFSPWFGRDAPDFMVTDIEGKQHRLSNYLGRDVLVVFWATWCPACNLEIPHLIELRKILSEDKLAILAISNESPELLRLFAIEKEINYTLVSLDSNSLSAPFANVRSIPTTFFIDSNGAIKLAAEGLVSLEQAQAIIQAEQ